MSHGREGASSQALRVARYYDATTRVFLRADAARTGTLHRRVWAPGVTTARDAAEHVHRWLAGEIGRGAREVLDLGCGVGATCLYLCDALPARLTGVTLSAVQHALARASAARRGVEPRCRFLHADFMRLREVVAEAAFDAAFAVEAFIHAPDAAGFFAEAARALRPGGRLFLCDDFLTPAAPASDPALTRLRRGWHAASLLTPAFVAEAASAHGLRLVRDEDLTPYLRLNPRPLLGALAAAGDVLSSWLGLGTSGLLDNWVGGTGLQQCQHRGWVAYRRMAFEKA